MSNQPCSSLLFPLPGKMYSSVNHIDASNIVIFIKHSREMILKRKMKEMSHDIEEQQIRQLSAAFEAKLYKCAPALEFHRDYSTLESRVRLLAIQLGQKLERKKRRRMIPILSDKERISTFNSSERNSGISFEDIQEIVETVKSLRKNGYNDMRLREEGEGATTCRGLSCLVPSNPSKGGSTKHISIAMKNIYFRTRLVEAFEKLHNVQTEEAILSYSKDVDWKSLINEAKENIQHFERWKKIQYPRCA